MKILIEIPDEAHKALKLLATLEDTTMDELKKEIFIAGLGALSEENKQLAALLKSKK